MYEEHFEGLLKLNSHNIDIVLFLQTHLRLHEETSFQHKLNKRGRHCHWQNKTSMNNKSRGVSIWLKIQKRRAARGPNSGVYHPPLKVWIHHKQDHHALKALNLDQFRR
jgi:hypothetical protein